MDTLKQLLNRIISLNILESAYQNQLKGLLLQAENNNKTDSSRSFTEAKLLNLVENIFIVNGAQLPEDVLQTADVIWRTIRQRQNPITVADILSIKNEAIVSNTNNNTTLCVIRGDICALQIDAIVNAANNEGLGCFIPSHKCIDNVIHRNAGPRLRMACEKELMRSTTEGKIATGGVPLCTDAFELPAKKILHVVGPIIQKGLAPSETQIQQLQSCYQKCLDVCKEKHLRHVAFPCISTGLFNFPQELAARLAVKAVSDWLEANKNHKLELVVFNTFLSSDLDWYLSVVKTAFPLAQIKETALDKACRFYRESEYVLIVAGAGMSVKSDAAEENVYVNPGHFAKHYGTTLKMYGYTTAYEAMGLLRDGKVPLSVKFGFWLKHFNNMRYVFTPCENYKLALALCERKKDYFVHTSNVDGNFEKSGFDPAKLYTCQGDWMYYQCTKPCRKTAVFETKPMLDKLLPELKSVGNGYILPEEKCPSCPYCQSVVFGNVRGGDWYLHTKYEEQSERYLKWLTERLGDKVCIVEIGVGFNTPMVTRYPVESYLRENRHARLIRINPTDFLVPSDLDGKRAIGLSASNTAEILSQIMNSTNHSAGSYSSTTSDMGNGEQAQEIDLETKRIREVFGHFEWRTFLNNLKG